MTPEERRNEQTIRSLYEAAEGNVRDAAAFISFYAEDGYFNDVSAGQKYYGEQLRDPIDRYDSAFPDMHRELDQFFFAGDVVIVTLSLNGTHKGHLRMSAGTIPPTHKVIHAPCCDVFRLKDGKVLSFDCYLAATILLGQLGVLGDLNASFSK